jgi:hypothetical protein
MGGCIMGKSTDFRDAYGCVSGLSGADNASRNRCSVDRTEKRGLSSRALRTQIPHPGFAPPTRNATFFMSAPPPLPCRAAKGANLKGRQALGRCRKALWRRPPFAGSSLPCFRRCAAAVSPRVHSLPTQHYASHASAPLAAPHRVRLLNRASSLVLPRLRGTSG